MPDWSECYHLTDEVSTEQLRSWTAEIIECKNCAADKKHDLENGESTVEIEKEKEPEEARKINHNPEKSVMMNTEKLSDVVEPAQAWKFPTRNIQVLLSICTSLISSNLSSRLV